MKKKTALLLALCLCFPCLISCSAVRLTYKDAELYTVGEGVFEADKIKSIDINWYGGKIVFLADGDEVRISESADVPEADKLRYLLTEDGELKIQCRESFDLEDIKDLKVEVPKKTLTVSLPATLRLVSLSVNATDSMISSESINADSLYLSNITGDITVGETTADTVDITSVSGDIKLSKCSEAKKVSLNSTSGEIECADISSAVFNAVTVSGDVEITESAFESDVNIDTVSGDIEFSGGVGGPGAVFKSISGDVKLLLLNDDVSIEFETVSGEIKNRLDEIDTADASQEPAETSEVYLWGSGEKKISIKTTSGNAEILKNEKIN